MADENPEDWGAIRNAPAAEGDAEDLGRATDLSFLGEAGTDPVGAGQAGVQELMRTGEVGGLEIMRGDPLMSDFPMEPGESRAAKELPELFMGKTIMNPRVEELEATLDDPDKSMWQKMGAQMELMDLAEHQEMTQRVGSGVAAHLSMGDKATISAAALTMFDPAEIAQMLTQVDPETGERRWPEFAIQHAPDGTIIVANNKTGLRAVINRPGFSATDAVQALGIAAIFTPAGRVTSALSGTAARIVVGGTAAGTTEHLIQKGHEAAGGQYDTGDVALSTAVGPLVDVARPLMGAVQRTGRFIGSYIPVDWGKKVGMATGLDRAIPAAKATMLTFAKNAKEYLQSGRNAIITTQDAVPEAHTPFRQILLKMVERMPITGTGALRKRQQQQRVEILANLADRYGLNPNSNYGARVLSDINQAGGARLTAARANIDEGIEAMAGSDVVLRDFAGTIKALIKEEEKFGDLANKPMLDLLNKVRTTVWTGGRPQTGTWKPLPRDFGSLNDWVERLYLEAGRAPVRAREPIEKAAQALQRDLARHAADEGGEAGARWIKGTQELKTIVSGSEKKTLQGLIEAGEVDHQVMRRVLKSGSISQLKQLYDNLTPAGLQEARQMILRNAMRVGGWRRSKAIEMVVDPKKVLRWMESEPVEAQFRTFFPGETAQAELGGMLEYLRMTAAAQETGKGVGMAAAGGIGQVTATAVNFVTLGVAGLLGHAYQSAPARNLLLRLYHVRSDPRMKDAVMNELTPLLMAGGRQMSQHWNEDNVQRSTYVSDEFSEEQDPSGVPPGIMEQLRNAAGSEDDEQPGVTQRLGEMLFPDTEEPVE